MSRAPIETPDARSGPAWLAPAGALYLRLARAWHGAWDRGLRRPQNAGVPVVSVGNLLAGGTGKTPAVAWLVERFAARGVATAVVSRGYGGDRDDDPLLVARGGALLADASRAGDEPVLLAATTHAAVVAVGRRRIEAARLAVREGAALIVLDDGFQHRALARDVDVVLLDAARPFGNGRGLPAGPMREPRTALARADVVLLTRCPPPLLEEPGALPAAHWPPALRATLDPAGGTPVFASAHRPDALLLPDGTREDPSALEGRRVAAVSGIARPETFAETLGALGARLVLEVPFRDHHRYSADEVRDVARRARAAGAELLVTTEKDATRWPDGADRPAVLTVRLRVPAGEALMERLDAHLSARTVRGRR